MSEEVWYTLNHGCAIYSTGGHDHPILLNVGVWNPPAKFLLWPGNIDILPLTQYFTVPHLFLQESGHSSRIPVESTGIPVEFQWNPQESTGIPLEFHWNKTGIKQTKVKILYLTLHILPIYRTTYFSLLSLLFLHLFKSVSQFLQSVYSSTLPSKFNFK